MSEVPTIVSPLLGELPGVRHGFFTRQGGVSEGVYASLNVGVGSGDDPGCVMQNRRRAAAAFDLPADALVNAYQVHSAEVVTIDVPIAEFRAQQKWAGPPRADGVVTKMAGVLCGALAADCAPVLVAEPEARVVAAVHAGWRGALAGVVEAAVAAMASLGASPARMTAAVGPCIGPASYEVGLEFMDAFAAADASHVRFFKPGATADKHFFDLPGFVLSRLAAAGVPQAEWIGCDTYSDEARFFSNRRAVHRSEQDYGRLLSAITLDA